MIETLSDSARELIPETSINLITNIKQYCDSILSVEIKSPTQYEEACNTVKQLSEFANLLETERKNLKKPYDEKIKVIQEAFVPFINIVESTKRKIKSAIWTYQQEIERKRREEQERLDREAAEKRREAEENARLEREKADILRLQGRDDLAKEAEARAEIIENKAAEIMPAIAAAPIPNTAPRGVAGRVIYRGIVDDPVLFKQHCIKEGLFDFLQVDEKAWNQYAKIKKTVMEVPGAKIIKEMV